MNKIKTTKKAMKESYNKIVSVGYCDAQFLLQFESPIAYSTRVEGWACDYYDIDGVLVSTGYAPLKARNTTSNYDVVRKYDDEARKIVYSDAKYEDIKEKLSGLLASFIKEVSISK